MSRSLRWPIALVVGLLLSQGAPPSAQSPSDVLTLISPDGRETVALHAQDMVALDDLVRRFELEVDDESRTGTVTVSSDGEVIILTADQRLVSVSGRLVSLSAAPRRSGGEWQVPLDFLSEALGPMLGENLELRARSHLLLVGDVIVPRVTGRYRTRGSGGRLSLEVTPSVPHTVREGVNGLDVRFEADALDIEQMPTARGDIIADIAVDRAAVGLRLTPGPAFDSFSASSRSIRRDGLEVVLDFRAAGQTTDASPASPNPPSVADAAPATTVDPLPDLRSARTLRVVAIDAGHGGTDEGTRGEDGTLEKDITLSVTRRLRDAVEAQLGLRVVLTRSRDETVGLDARAAIANNNKADLLISLHVNASVRPSVTGAEVYYLSMDEYGEAARELAQSDAQPVPVVGGGTREIDLVQWEMAQVRYLDLSAGLADIVHEELSRRIPMTRRDVQEAPFRVLVGANMPAVLIEMGFVSNAADEQRLTSARFQNAVVDAVIGSILRFRDEVEQPDRAMPASAGADGTPE
jgi:N-acetylmuramoyl-L-alanine amidase